MTERTDDGLGGLPAIVTGSSRGLGRAFAQALARAGARVVVNGTNADTTEAAAAAIRAEGGTAIACAGSVADDDFCRRLIDTCVRTYGGVGLLVNNAGLTRDRTLSKMSAAEFDEVVAVHLRGTWACGAAAARAMRETGGGRILNITSGSGLYGTFGQANYAAAKAGVIGLTRVMDFELWRHGIRVNALAPVARTDMTARFETGGHQHEFPPADTVAPIVVHLAGDAARHLHGQVLSFDGTTLSVWSHPVATFTWEHADGWSSARFAAVLSEQTAQRPNPDKWGSGVLPV